MSYEFVWAGGEACGVANLWSPLPIYSWGNMFKKKFELNHQQTECLKGRHEAAAYKTIKWELEKRDASEFNNAYFKLKSEAICYYCTCRFEQVFIIPTIIESYILQNHEAAVLLGFRSEIEKPACS